MRAIILSFVIILLQFYGQAQQLDPDTSNANPLRNRTGAILFKIELQNNQFWPYLLAFSGKTFSGKYHISEWKAVRIGVSVDGDLFHLDNAVGPAVPTSQQRSGVSLRIESEYLIYTALSGGLLFYYGGGPILGYSRTSYSNSDSKQRNGLVELGLSGTIGVEYVLFDRVSILAEYVTQGIYSRQRSHYTGSHSVETVVTWVSVESTPIRLGLSIYF
ncbi:MAG TPA: hypothetical protein VNN76_05580 [Bacteroidota bacterium]|nr:hypothetical protein [Bacteroidota bacterium]